MSKIWLGIAGLAIAGVVGVVLWLAIPPDRPAQPPTVARPDVPAPVAEPARGVEIAETDRVYGDPNAPIVIVEYASLTCPHCADFHNEVWPRLKESFVEPGHVRLVYRDFPLDQLALRAAGLARCVEGDAYFGFLDMLYGSFESWTRAPDPLGALARLGRLAGLSEARVQSCLEDEAALDRVIEERLAGERLFQVNSTPTFVIDGRVYRGKLTYEQMAEVLTPLVN